MHDAWRSLFVLLACSALVYLFYRHSIPFWALGFCVVTIVSLDLGGVGRRYINEDRLTESSSVEDEITAYPFDEFILERRAEAGGDGTFRVLSLEGNPLSSARPSYFYESLGGYSGARLRVYQDYFDHILFGPGQNALNDNALDIMNVRYLVSSRGLPGYELVFQDDLTSFSIFRNPDALDRATLVDRATFAGSPEEIWGRLNDPTFEPASEILFLENDPFSPSDLAVEPADSSGIGRVQMTNYTGQDMTFSVSTPGDRWLLLSETFYPEGWTATIDEAETPIYRANYLLRAIRVPAGDHDIRLTFHPASVRLGSWATAGGTVIAYGLLIVLLGLAYLRRSRASE